MYFLVELGDCEKRNSLNRGASRSHGGGKLKITCMGRFAPIKGKFV